MLAVLLSLLAHADCPPDPFAAVEREYKDLLVAFRGQDGLAFDLSAKELDAFLRCLDRPVTTEEAAEIHRYKAMVAFVDGQPTATRKSLAAVRLLDPSWLPDPELFPTGHPMRDHFVDAGQPGESVPPAVTTNWVIDGTPGSNVPLDRAFLLQSLDEAGKVVYTGYHHSVVEVPRELSVPQDVRGATLQVGLGLLLGLGQVRQQSTASVNLLDVDSPLLAIGGQADTRWLANELAGLDLALAVRGNTDPVQGGGLNVEGRLVGLLFTEADQPRTRWRLGGRAGFGVDSLRAWLPSGEHPFVLPCLVLGPDLSVAHDPILLRLQGELWLASAWVPYQWRASARLGAQLQEPLALELDLTTLQRSLSLATNLDSEVGQREEFEFRPSLFLSIWR